jgi:hypothetical protein
MNFSYNRYGQHQAIEGATWESDHANTRTTCIYAAPVNLSVTINPALLTVGTQVPFEVVTADGIYVNVGYLDTTKPASTLFGQLAVQLSNPFSATFVSNTAITISCMQPGLGLSVTVGSAPAVTVASTNQPAIRAGRLVVPDSNGVTTAGYAVGPGIYNHAPYRYPALGDDTDGRLSAAIFTSRDWHSNATYGLGLDFSQGNTTTAGTPFTGFTTGSRLWIRPLVLLNSDTLYVETLGTDAGRLTITSSATTVPLPIGKISPLTEVLENGLQKIRINY